MTVTLSLSSNDINDSTRARCYILYDDFRFQPYLNLTNIEKNRVALSRFRASSHRQEVETGRWHKPVLKTCPSRFLFVYTCIYMYHDLRKHILNRIIGKD